MNYFRKKYGKGPARYIENSKMGPDRPRSLKEIMQSRAYSIFIFSRAETCLKFTLGQVNIHSFEVHIMLNGIHFHWFLSV